MPIVKQRVSLTTAYYHSAGHRIGAHAVIALNTQRTNQRIRLFPSCLAATIYSPSSPTTETCPKTTGPPNSGDGTDVCIGDGLMAKPLMAKATAVWLVDNTTISFK